MYLRGRLVDRIITDSAQHRVTEPQHHAGLILDEWDDLDVRDCLGSGIRRAMRHGMAGEQIR